MAHGPIRRGLTKPRSGWCPGGIQHVMARVVGAHRAERLLVSGEMVDAARALEIGLVDELTDGDAVEARAREWLGALSTLPRRPMLQTRAIARADLVAALEPGQAGLEALLDAWSEP